MAMGLVSPSGPTSDQGSGWPSLQPTNGHSRYEPVPLAETPPSPFDPRKETDPTKTPVFSDTPLPWRPFYLQRTVILSFTVIFAAILVVIQVLLAISNRNNGLGTGYRGQQYLWIYGPTAFLTVVLAFWGRVEYQSKVAAPWIRLLASGQPALPSQTLLLDYLSDFQPYSAIKALRSKDYVVSIAATVSVMLNIIIVLSTGLITLSRTTVVRNPYPLTVQDAFVDNPGRLKQAGTLSWYMSVGILDANLTYLPGISDKYAFQSISMDGLPDGAETSVFVDGLENSLECESVQDLKFIHGEPFEVRAGKLLHFSLRSPGCNIDDIMFRGPVVYSCLSSQSNCSVATAQFLPVNCDGIDGSEGRRMLAMFGNVSWWNDWSRNHSDYTGSGRIPTYVTSVPKSTQMLCVPKYSIGPVEVIHNGSSQSVRPVPGGERRTLGSVSAWNILDAYLDSLTNPILNQEGYSKSYYSNISGTLVSWDNGMQYALKTQLSPGVPPTTLYDPAALRKLISDEYRRSTASIAKIALMDPAGDSVAILGSMTVDGERLLVRSWAAHTMGGLVAFCFVLTVVASFLVTKHGILPRSPGTTLTFASMLVSSPQLTERLRFSGDADTKTMARVLQGSAFQSGLTRDPASGQTHFVIRDTHNALSRNKTWTQFRSLQAHPLIFHPTTRVVMTVILFGLIVTLELLLRKANNEDGLGDIGGNDTYIRKSCRYQASLH